MTELFSDNAAAELTLIEEGCLRGLASYETPMTVGDLSAFVAGYVRSAADHVPVRDALCALDALGWAEPADDRMPYEASEWRLTEQGRIALEGRRP